MGCNGMGWVGLGWDGLGWDGLGWDGMAWDWLGRGSSRGCITGIVVPHASISLMRHRAPGPP